MSKKINGHGNDNDLKNDFVFFFFLGLFYLVQLDGVRLGLGRDGLRMTASWEPHPEITTMTAASKWPQLLHWVGITIFYFIFYLFQLFIFLQFKFEIHITLRTQSLPEKVD